jgi:hypothetical protein
VTDVNLACDFIFTDPMVNDREESLGRQGETDLLCELLTCLWALIVLRKVDCAELGKVDVFFAWFDWNEVLNPWKNFGDHGGHGMTDSRE